MLSRRFPHFFCPKNGLGQVLIKAHPFFSLSCGLIKKDGEQNPQEKPFLSISVSHNVVYLCVFKIHSERLFLYSVKYISGVKKEELTTVLKIQLA